MQHIDFFVKKQDIHIQTVLQTQQLWAEDEWLSVNGVMTQVCAVFVTDQEDPRNNAKSCVTDVVGQGVTWLCVAKLSVAIVMDMGVVMNGESCRVPHVEMVDVPTVSTDLDR